MMDLQVIEMGFGKMAMLFIIISMFSIVMVGMASMMVKDKPTDAYYTMENKSATNSVNLVMTTFGVATNLMVPIIAISGILMLGAAFMWLRKA
jgi:hypothetical protein